MMFRIILMMMLAAASLVHAQIGDPCMPEGCRTQTQGGWGGNCNGNNPGCVRDANFAAVFPNGLTVGGDYTILFTTSAAVRNFLPAGGTGGVLTQNYNNPTSTSAGVFAGQVTALAVSLGFSNAGVTGFCNLGALYYLSAYHLDDNPFAGMTVQELFALANDVLGGDVSGLPFGTAISDLNDVITDINENFVDGTQNHGNLVTGDCDFGLPVELASFSGVARNGTIELFWTTASESNVERFEIERSANSGNGVIGSVHGLGDSPIGHSYRFVDTQVSAGKTYVYRLIEVALDGSRRALAQTVTVEAGAPTAMPTEFALLQNYPNPFNPSTTISFSLPDAADVSLVVFDALGRQVATLMTGTLGAGTHDVSFGADNLSAGLYFYQLKAGEFTAVRKMMLLK